jgi:hypothetical protein
MEKKAAYLGKGRTGKEGAMLKSIGILVAAVGLIWTLLVFEFSESGTAWIFPVCVMMLGGPLFLIGRSIAKNSAARA